MGQDEDKPIELSIWVGAAPETLFAFLTDPERLIRWMGVMASLEPRAGGLFQVNVNGVDVIRGSYLEVDPPRRVVFTWGYEGGEDRLQPGSTTVEFVLTPHQGGTQVELRHSGLPGPDRSAHAQGWPHYLGRLKTRAEGGDPGADPFASPEHRHGVRG